MARQFELLKVGGTPREIGLQVGDALRDKILLTIQQIYDYELTFFKWQTIGSYPELLDLTRDQVLARTREFLPHFERYAPGMVEELRGIAEGARISFEEALLLQIRGEIVYAMTSGCTAFAISAGGTRDGRALAGQNWDYAIDVDLGVMHLLHVTPKEGPRQLMLTYAGLTSFLGMNSAGVSSFANSLPWGWCKVGIPHYPVFWRVFRERDLAGVRRVIDETNTVQAENHVFADGSGAIADLELTPDSVTWLDDQEGFFVHTNHYVVEPNRSRPDLQPTIADTTARFKRMRELISARYGQLDVSSMQGLLADHEGYPTSICRHEAMPDGTPGGPAIGPTVASMISVPQRGVMYVCAGKPCEGEYVEYQV